MPKKRTEKPKLSISTVDRDTWSRWKQNAAGDGIARKWLHVLTLSGTVTRQEYLEALAELDAGAASELEKWYYDHGLPLKELPPKVQF